MTAAPAVFVAPPIPLEVVPNAVPPAGQPLLRVRGANHAFGTGEARTQVLFDNNLELMPSELVIMSVPEVELSVESAMVGDAVGQS